MLIRVIRRLQLGRIFGCTRRWANTLLFRHTRLCWALEYLKFPYNVSGQILTKSSIARTFMVIETAPWIHPSYRGCLTLEIANVSNTTILLYPGTPIGQLILMDADVTEEPKKLSGSYIGPIFPEPPVLRSPEEELIRVGIKQYRHPTQGWINLGRMRTEIDSIIGPLAPAERANIKAVIRVLSSTGGLVPGGPADRLLR